MGSSPSCTDGWARSDQFASAGNRVEKLAAEARPFQFVPANRLGELG